MVNTAATPTVTAHISPLLQDTEEFCRETLCHPDVVGFVDSTFVAWGGSIHYSDAFRVGWPPVPGPMDEHTQCPTNLCKAVNPMRDMGPPCCVCGHNMQVGLVQQWPIFWLLLPPRQGGCCHACLSGSLQVCSHDSAENFCQNDGAAAAASEARVECICSQLWGPDMITHHIGLFVALTGPLDSDRKERGRRCCCLKIL